MTDRYGALNERVYLTVSCPQIPGKFADCTPRTLLLTETESVMQSGLAQGHSNLKETSGVKTEGEMKTKIA
jgi:hypothetical protein